MSVRDRSTPTVLIEPSVMNGGDASRQRSAIMRRVGQKNTGPEIALRKILFGLGYRYRLHVRGLPGTPDVAFTGRKKAIFVHGCFWHRHSGCLLASNPKTNMQFWRSKFAANVRRDHKKKEALERAGWSVLIVWQCEIHKPMMSAKLRRFLGATRVTWK
jgi:DNA mismatch endonuclease, patch repair protein